MDYVENSLLLSVLSYLAFAISTSIDKFFMNNGHNPILTNTLKMYFNACVLLILGLIFFDFNLGVNLIFAALCLGFLYALAGVLYFKSLQLVDLQVFLPISQSLIILILFVVSIILFQEKVFFGNVFGIILLMLGLCCFVANKGFSLLSGTKSSLTLVAMIVFSVLYGILVKFFLFYVEPINLAILMYFSSALFLTVYLFFRRKEEDTLNIRSAKILVSAFFGAMGTFLLYMALSVGDAAKVFPVNALQFVFVFIFAILFLREKFCWRKLWGTLIVVMGVYLVSL